MGTMSAGIHDPGSSIRDRRQGNAGGLNRGVRNVDDIARVQVADFTGRRIDLSCRHIQDTLVGHRQLSRLVASLKDEFETRTQEIDGSTLVFVRPKE